MLHAVQNLYEVNLGNYVENIANKVHYMHYTKLGLELLKKKVGGKHLLALCAVTFWIIGNR
jgi:hypothetical protein